MPDLFASEDKRVKLTHELARVARLPRRTWSDEDATELAYELTLELKTPYGTMLLRPKQAIALYELAIWKGLFGPLPVGIGKTLISLLAPVVTFAERPLLIIPAKLVEKTLRDARELRQHWRIPERLNYVTYQWLGRIQAQDALHRLMPDLVVFDEAHWIRNRTAAVTRRVRRYLSENPSCVAATMSGTMTKRSIHDYNHMLGWVYAGDTKKMPLPREWSELELWADALDRRKDQVRTAQPEALQILCNAEEKQIWKSDPTRAARLAFRRRLVETEGVVAAEETPVDATLTIQELEFEVEPVIDEAFRKLRQEAETPDGAPLFQGLEVHRHARELALGFFYRWDPAPPKDWLEARREWSKFVRKVIKHSRRYDSELQVRRAFPETAELKAWNAVKHTFTPNTVPVWLSQRAVECAVNWATANVGIVWVEHVTFGQQLEQYGIAYYGKKGQRQVGAYRNQLIDDHDRTMSLAASVHSNSEGRNLQAWSQNLVTSAPPNGKMWEQLLGRTHREGQEADEVEVDVFTVCAEHVKALHQAVQDSEYVHQTMGVPQKMLLAGKNFRSLTDLAGLRGSRWET